MLHGLPLSHIYRITALSTNIQNGYSIGRIRGLSVRRKGVHHSRDFPLLKLMTHQVHAHVQTYWHTLRSFRDRLYNAYYCPRNSQSSRRANTDS